MNELQSVTDIDEVIKYAERRAEGCHQMASSYHTDEGVYLQEETRCMYRAILWENIHEWLEELKELRKKARPHGVWIKERLQIDELHFRSFAKCKVCGCEFKPYSFAVKEFDFCPKCGADMREGDSDA